MTINAVDHVSKGYDRLLEQFKDKENIYALLVGWLTAVQATEDSLFSLLDERSLNTATGSQLDDLGKLVGREREGADDETYRRNINFQILINNAQGTPNDVLEILSILTNASKVQSFEHYPVGGNLYTNGDTLPEGFAKVLRSVLPLTHDTSHMYYDPNNNAFTPVGDENIVSFLQTTEGAVLEAGGFILSFTSSQLVDDPLGILPEYDHSGDDTGVLCEVYEI